MKGEVHSYAAKFHFEVAEAYDKKFQEEIDTNKKTAYMVVAAQNYFYSAINAIEYKFFKEKGAHSFNHENRYRKIKEYVGLFSVELVKLYNLVDRDFRNKVAYKGENSEKYETVKRLANVAKELL